MLPHTDGPFLYTVLSFFTDMAVSLFCFTLCIFLCCSGCCRAFCWLNGVCNSLQLVLQQFCFSMLLLYAHNSALFQLNLLWIQSVIRGILISFKNILLTMSILFASRTSRMMEAQGAASPTRARETSLGFVNPRLNRRRTSVPTKSDRFLKSYQRHGKVLQF